MKSLLLVCALMLAAVPAMAVNADNKAQHDISRDREAQGERLAKAAHDSADGETKAAAKATAKAAKIGADIAADLAGCPTCH